MSSRPRKDPDQSQETLKLIMDLGVSPANGRSGVPVYKEMTSSLLSSWSKGFALRPPHFTSVLPFPQWDRSTDKLKAAYCQRALQELGATHTFSVNLSEALIADARASGSSFMKYLQERTARYLKERAGRVSYWFALETTKVGREHLHGAFASDGHEIDVVRDALRDVAKLLHETRAARSVFMRPITDGYEWATYALKSEQQTRRHVGGSVLTASKDINQAARASARADRKAFLWATNPRKADPNWGLF